MLLLNATIDYIATKNHINWNHEYLNIGKATYDRHLLTRDKDNSLLTHNALVSCLLYDLAPSVTYQYVVLIRAYCNNIYLVCISQFYVGK